MEDRDPKANTAPYLNVDAIDERWMMQFWEKGSSKPEQNSVSGNA